MAIPCAAVSVGIPCFQKWSFMIISRSVASLCRRSEAAAKFYVNIVHDGDVRLHNN